MISREEMCACSMQTHLRAFLGLCVPLGTMLCQPGPLAPGVGDRDWIWRGRGRVLLYLERSWESATVFGWVVCGTMSHDVLNAKNFHVLISLLI